MLILKFFFLIALRICSEALRLPLVIYAEVRALRKILVIYANCLYLSLI